MLSIKLSELTGKKSVIAPVISNKIVCKIIQYIDDLLSQKVKMYL